MHLPYGWQNMTASDLDQYLATHSQAEIKAANDQRLDNVLRNQTSQQPTINGPVTEEPYIAPTMNSLGLFGDGVQHAGGGRLLEASPQPVAPAATYYGAGGGPLPSASAPPQHNEEPYDAPNFWQDWGTRLHTLDRQAAPARNQADYLRGPGVPAEETPYIAPTMDFSRD